MSKLKVRYFYIFILNVGIVVVWNYTGSTRDKKEITMAIGQPCPIRSVPGPPTDPRFDLLSMKRPEYLQEFRNPCWRTPYPPSPNGARLRCLPLFYLIGQPKCGTTDLFEKITSHFQISNATKSSALHWLSRNRFRLSHYLKDAPLKWRAELTFCNFARMFRNNTKEIVGVNRIKGSINNYHDMIIGEGSPSTFAHNPHWKSYVGNENCEEPRIINPIYLRHIVPQARVILTLRDPVFRLHSSYFFFMKQFNMSRGAGTPEDFHRRVLDNVAVYRDCFSRHGVRKCAYNNTLQTNFRMAYGFYSVYLEDWFRTFPREQMFITHMEDYSEHPKEILSRIFRFLGVQKLSDSKMKNIVSQRRRNIGVVKMSSYAMLPQTEKLLREFYRPFQEKLTAMLQEHPNIY